MKKHIITLATFLLLTHFAWGGIEFRDASFEPIEGYSEITHKIGMEEKKVYISPKALLDSTALEEVYVAPSGTLTDHRGNTETLYGVAIILTDEGAEKMKEITKDRISKPLAIIVDGEILSLPVVRAKIGKRSTITGPGTKEEAEAMKDRIISSR
ncbi:MAG: hypothetical protein JJT75_08515 [Opitutales bacterium]|nr:hypothetical protein [Opitutales bacterium]MCH8539345.1 hypothetical protein [Opitutales bacterium]